MFMRFVWRNNGCDDFGVCHSFFRVCICALLLSIYNVLNEIYQQQKDARPPDDAEADTSAEQKTVEDH